MTLTTFHLGHQLKKDQDELERLLWSEREAIYTKYDEKFKVAQTK